MTQKTGIWVNQGVSSGTTNTSTPSGSNIGLIMSRVRGVPNVPTLVNSLQQDRMLFGGIDTVNTTSYGAYITRHIFNNAGQFGATIYGVRVVGTGSVAASGILTDGADVSQTFSASKTTTGTSSTYTAWTCTPGTIAINDVFTISIGTTVVQYTSVAGTAADVVTGLKAGILAKQAGNEQLPAIATVDTSGPTGTGVITYTGIAPAGFIVGAHVFPKQLLGCVLAGTPYADGSCTIGSINTAAKTITLLDSTSTLVTFTGTLIALASTLWANVTYPDWVYITPTGTTTLILTSTIYGATSFTPTAGVGANNILTVTAGQFGASDPGTWGNNLTCIFYPNGSQVAGNYLLQVFLSGSVVETWQATTWALLISTVNTQSSYITLTDIASTTYNINTTQTVVLANGIYNLPIESDATGNGTSTGLHALDGFDVQLIAGSDWCDTTFATALQTYCSGRDRCMGVQSMGYNANSTDAITWDGLLQTNQSTGADPGSYIAVYDFWVQTNNENNSSAWVPSTGIVLGSGYLRITGINNGKVYFPPAGSDSSFQDVFSVTSTNRSQATLDTYTTLYTINCAIWKKGYGYMIYSSRTMSMNTLFASVHIRRQTNFYMQWLLDNLFQFFEKPNNTGVDKAIFVKEFQFFKDEYNNGALEQSIPLSNAVTIAVNKDPVQRRVVNNIINFIPTECIEGIQISLNRNDGLLVAIAAAASTTQSQGVAH